MWVWVCVCVRVCFTFLEEGQAQKRAKRNFGQPQPPLVIMMLVYGHAGMAKESGADLVRVYSKSIAH